MNAVHCDTQLVEADFERLLASIERREVDGRRSSFANGALAQTPCARR